MAGFACPAKIFKKQSLNYVLENTNQVQSQKALIKGNIYLAKDNILSPFMT